MTLSRPTYAIWSLATLLAIAVIAMRYASVTIPGVSPVIGDHLFEALLISFILLWVGTVFRGV